MKKGFTLIAFTAIAAIAGLSSCDKITEKLFSSFFTNQAEEDFTINVITTTSLRTDLGTVSTNLNIDSIIKAETDNKFSLDDIKSVNIEEVKFTLLNPDNTNNFANFEEGWLMFNTNTVTAPVLVASGLNPDIFADMWLLPVDKSINYKEHLRGNQLTYIVSAKARRVTTKKLDCRMSIKFKVN